MSTPAITLDMSKSTAIDKNAPLTLDLSKSTSLTLSRLVSPKGETVYANDPAEVADKRKQGYTLINQDGTFTLQNIRGEDPLDEAKRRELVFNTLSKDEQGQQNTQTLKEFGKAGIKAGVATAVGAAAAPLAETAITATNPLTNAALNLAKAHPWITTAIATHLGRELGIPLPKALDVIGKFFGEGQ